MQISNESKDGINTKINTFLFVSDVQKQLFADLFQKTSRPATF